MQAADAVSKGRVDLQRARNVGKWPGGDDDRVALFAVFEDCFDGVDLLLSLFGFRRLIVAEPRGSVNVVGVRRLDEQWPIGASMYGNCLLYTSPSPRD